MIGHVITFGEISAGIKLLQKDNLQSICHENVRISNRRIFQWLSFKIVDFFTESQPKHQEEKFRCVLKLPEPNMISSQSEVYRTYPEEYYRTYGS